MQPLLSTWTLLPNAGLRIDLVRACMAHNAQLEIDPASQAV
ncbi:hypothetical protein P368_22490 [Comamonas thiooxydans]|nr:hypothetical protein P365_24585 [Comamonas thiooxydans]KGH06210.1 hypothetical protein P368_22490 [Comamonas thiooxydans]